MSKKAGLRILDSQNAATAGDKGSRDLLQTAGRRKLADISNLPQNQRPLFPENKSQFVATAMKEYIDQLQKENMVLVKMLAQRNKMIEQSGAELDRLRVNLVKMQEQNQQLALSNSQMLSELNSGKERLKVLQHELGCKSSLLKARRLELEVKESKRTCTTADAEFRDEDKSLKEGGHDEKHCKDQLSLQSNSLAASEKLLPEQKIESKRRSTRRQSSKFNVAELKPDEISSEADGSKPLPENYPSEGLITENASVKNDGSDEIPQEIYESQKSGRPSHCRPTRQAAGKVRSYKEMPLNVKMRRT